MPALMGNPTGPSQGNASSQEVEAMALSIQKLRDHVRTLDVKVDQAALQSQASPRNGRDGRDGKDAANLKRDIEGHQIAIAQLEKRVHDLERGAGNPPYTGPSCEHRRPSNPP